MTTLEDIRDWFSELSLATKSLILVGGATALILTLSLSLPLLRMNGLVGAGELELSRTLYAAWNAFEERTEDEIFTESEIILGGAMITPLDRNEYETRREENRFLARALRKFERSENSNEFFGANWSGWNRVYQYARSSRDADGEIERVVLLEHRADGAGWLLVVNLLYVLIAGATVFGVALVVYASIINKLILSPVLSLQKTAELVRDGNLDIRSQIDTGDEFEELAETINLMLSALSRQRNQLQDANKAMDIKLAELSQANSALFESARLKGEFLASVSHELRTPLNAIIGFAELLLEIARKEIAIEAEGGDLSELNNESGEINKRERYLVNIVSAGRTLLEMIESLLEMAKIEAGRVELDITQMSMLENCQALVGLIHPLARKKGIQVRLDIASDLPLIETDAKKFQQIIFNLLSNAVKFTGNDERQGEIILRAEKITHDDSGDDRVRVSVIDNGDGIEVEDQKRIFDKFQQVDSSHTRSHTGTGLGLAIVLELTRLLQGEIQLVSEIGDGSMFSIMIPVKIDQVVIEETKLESKFRGSLRENGVGNEEQSETSQLTANEDTELESDESNNSKNHTHPENSQ